MADALSAPDTKKGDDFFAWKVLPKTLRRNHDKRKKSDSQPQQQPQLELPATGATTTTATLSDFVVANEEQLEKHESELFTLQTSKSADNISLNPKKKASSNLCI